MELRTNLQYALHSLYSQPVSSVVLHQEYRFGDCSVCLTNTLAYTVSMTFLLLKLPYLVIRKVLSNSNFRELLEFSLLSSKCRRLVKSIKRHHRYIGIDIFSNDGWPRLTFKTNETSDRLSWYFNSECFKKVKRKKRGEERKQIEIRRIGGVDVQMIHLAPNGIVSPQLGEFQMKIIFDYLQEILSNLPIHNIYRSSYQEDRPFVPKYLGIEECEEMSVYGRKGPISDEHLRYILEKKKITKKLVLCLPINPTFRQDSARFSTEELVIDHAHWMSRDTFLSLDCQRITLKNWGLQTMDFEDFVQRWLDSDDTSFIFLNMTFTGESERFDYNKFQAKRWDPETRGRYYGLSSPGVWRGSKLDCERGWDVIRKDSLMATIGYFCQGIMFFVVWHERFPKLDDLR